MHMIPSYYSSRMQHNGEKENNCLNCVLFWTWKFMCNFEWFWLRSQIAYALAFFQSSFLQQVEGL
jgi:hypothetical protein